MNRLMIALTIATTMMAGPFAQAAEIALEREIQGASIHEDGVDMVVYYTKTGDALEVVATYVEVSDPASPARMRMGLMDGDKVTFALPGHPGTHYTFARRAETVTVRTTPTDAKTQRLARAAR